MYGEGMRKLLILCVFLSSCAHLHSSTFPRGTNCPPRHPIKGNEDSGIFHVPGQEYYAATHPERCFRTEEAARRAGYRKAER